MTEEEMQNHIDAQRGTINEQKNTIEKQNADLESLRKDVEGLKSGATNVEDLTQKNADLQRQVDINDLKAKFPKVTDWSVIMGNTKEEMEKHAEAVSKMIPGDAPASKKEEPKVEGDGKGVASSPGDKFAGVGGVGAPAVEAVSEEQKLKTLAERNEAIKKGDLKTVLDKQIELNPKNARAAGLA